jgi:hypothetical protein
MHWLLVLALVFSPIQGAIAALYSDCANTMNTAISNVQVKKRP